MRLRSSVLSAALLLLTAAAGTADSRFEIQLLQERWTPAAGVPAAAVQALETRALALRSEGGARVHALVQLHAIPDEAEKNDLWRRGLELADYVPGQAWIAAIPASQLRAAAALPEVRWLAPWDASRKVHPNLAKGEIGDWALDPTRPEWVMLAVLLHQDVDLQRAWSIADEVGGVAMPPIEGLHGLTLWVPKAKLGQLAQIEDVLWIAEGPMPLTTTNDGSRANMRVNTVNAAPFSLTGTGVRVFVFDAGTVRTTHETFNPGTGTRATTIDTTAISNHSNHVAGTLGGDGAPSSAASRGRGVATGTTIFSAGYQQTAGTMLFWDNAGDIQADYALARNTHGADLGTNSIGSNTASNGYPCAREGDYDVSGALIDGIIRGNNATVGSAVLMTWANGNERSGGTTFPGRCGANYRTTAPPSCAKNPIHVGAINSDGGAMTAFSSWGPCDDGRLKPTLVAPGCETGRVTGETITFSSVCSATASASGAACSSDTLYGTTGFCGTSMATPAVAGTAALFTQNWRTKTGSAATARPLPALVKAMMVHTARDLGQIGPDFIYGYGAVDATNLIETLRTGTATLGGTGRIVWGTDSVTNAVTDSFTFAVPAGTAELKATLAWDDAAAAAFAASAPVNNLNLELVSPTGVVSRPWILNAASPHLAATTGVNNLDNQEQARVLNPAAGNWTVRVVGTAVPTAPQSYGLVYSATLKSAAATGCTTTSSTFEAGNDSWTLTGAARVAAPAAGHGSFSLRLGGTVSTTHEATRDFAVPATGSATWSFFWYMTTAEGASGHGYDPFIAEVRNTAGTVLAVIDARSDGWQASQWMQHANIDLTPWAGTTVRLTYRAVNDSSLATTFWVDDVAFATCPAAAFTSIAAEDGFVTESTETSNVGGTANAGTAGTSAIRVGDTATDLQVKGILSFDTAPIPDAATVSSVTLRIRRGTVVGTSPYSTHGAIRIEIRTGPFNGINTLEAADFQAAATATAVCTLTTPAANTDWSECTFTGAGATAINKTGRTQIRIVANLDDNDDLGDDYVGFYGGDADPTLRPILYVNY